jgi:hypothetical protein
VVGVLKKIGSFQNKRNVKTIDEYQIEKCTGIYKK